MGEPGGPSDESALDDLGWARYPETVAGEESKPPIGGITIGFLGDMYSKELLLAGLLALAATKVGPAYGDQEDDAHRLTTATMIARTPFGIQAKLVKDDGTTIYDAALRHLSQMCGTAEGVGED